MSSALVELALARELRSLRARAPALATPASPPDPADLRAHVARWLAEHPPASGRNPTEAEIAAAVASWLHAHPPTPGRDGVGIESARVADAGDLILGLTDGREINAGRVRGQDGENAAPGERVILAMGGGAGQGSAIRPRYTRALSGLLTVIPAAEHGIKAPLAALIRDSTGRVAVACVVIAADHTVTVSSVRPLDGLTLTLE